MAKKAPESDLTDQQKVFCEEYVKDLNGTQAALRAKYSSKGAEVRASELLRISKIKQYVQVLMDARSKRTQIDADRILQELARIGFSDIRTIFDDNGQIKEPKDWPDDIARCVASVEVLEEFEGTGKDRTWIGYTKKVKFWSKEKCLELMGKHKKLFTDVVEIHDDDARYERLAAARKRAGKN